MIPVAQQPEPTLRDDGFDFDAKVRRLGNRWLAKHGVLLTEPLPPGLKPKAYWRDCLDQLHSKYGGVCAYLCVYIEREVGGASVDHFVAKSLRADLTYEWSNYRLAATTMNSRKREFADVLDSFDIQQDTFHVNFADGSITPNPALPADCRQRASETVRRLGLDEQPCRKLRLRWFTDFADRQISVDYLRRHSPFVWYEASRQGLL